MQGIYKITNLITDKCYIGKTVNYAKRMQEHRTIPFQPEHKEYEKTLYKSIRKYGLDNFSFELIEELKDYSVSGEREQYYITLYNSYNNGYNDTPGGDGGSEKGHCQGETNGRAKLTENDVIMIRTLYANGISRSDCYKMFCNKISSGGFGRVWLGQTWSHIMPEVYTEENKKRNEKLGKGQNNKNRRLLSNDEVKCIRQMEKDGCPASEVYLIYQNKISKSTFDDIWYNRTYREIVV
jgi:group I intron endonuclease